MQKIESIESKSCPPNFLSRIYGGSTPKYFHIRFVGKSPSLFRPEITMDYMIPNEVICYALADLIPRLNVPEHFTGKHEGHPYLFTRDIDPRDDSKIGLYEISKDQQDALDSFEVHLSSVFNVWILNRDAVDNRNSVIVDGKLYLLDFGNALLGTNKGAWKGVFDYFRDNKEHSKCLIYSWLKLDRKMLDKALSVIMSIPDNEIEYILTGAYKSGLVDKEEYVGARDFLIYRKRNLSKVI